MSAQPDRQPANAHHLRVGDFVVTTLQGAYFQGTVKRRHTASRRSTPQRITFDAYLLDTADRKILIDTGYGALADDGGRQRLSLFAPCMGSGGLMRSAKRGSPA